MYKRIIAVATILSLNVSVWADYPSDRKAAMELVKAGKNEEALSAFDKMAKGTAVEAQKSDALEQAALCSNRLKKYDQAIELAGQIPSVPMAKSVKIQLMLENRKYEEIIAAFKDEDMSNWPEKAAGPAYFCLGRAYITVRDGKAAETDLKKAVETLGEGELKDQARLLLGETYRDILNDDAQALAVFTEGTKAQALYGWICMTCIISASDILAKQNKCDEALAVLGKVDSSKMTGAWKYNFILAYANVAAAQGKKEDAIAKLNEAMAAKDIADWQKTAFQKKLKELQETETK
jgi:tetratricopeptide (TPR) repeat protein